MVLVVGIAGCAAIFKGTRDDAFVLSNPPGAQVFVDGAYAGTTPMAVNLTADRTHSLQLRLPGYQDQAGVIQHQIGVGWVVLDVLCGVWPILIDALTGAWFHLDDVVVNLSPGGTAFLVPAYEQPPPLIPAAPDACPAGFHNIAAAGQVPVCEQ